MDAKYKLHGAFSWCELLTTDVADAKRFYSKLFGWTLEPAPMPGMEYTLVKYGGEQMGGIMAIPPAAKGMPPSWGSMSRWTMSMPPPSSPWRWAVRFSCPRRTSRKSDAFA